MITPLEMKVLMNHIYEYQKGVRQMVLFTCPKKYEEYATQRLQSQNIEYVLQPAGKTRPLNELTPEEDFILGTMLGYDLCAQCQRFCQRKCRKVHNMSS